MFIFFSVAGGFEAIRARYFTVHSLCGCGVVLFYVFFGVFFFMSGAPGQTKCAVWDNKVVLNPVFVYTYGPFKSRYRPYFFCDQDAR